MPNSWLLGCRQVVRHGVLISAFPGSNPGTPANFVKQRLNTMLDMKIFSGSACPKLAKKVAEKLGLPLGEVTVGRFSDGEIMVELLENVRGQNVFIVQSTCAPVNDHLMEMIVLSDALKRSSAASITAIVPYFGYARQDRRVRSARVPITAKVVANMMTTAGIDRIITVDLHADQIQGFFSIPVDNIYATGVMIDHIQQKQIKNPLIISPDVGGVVRARAFTKRIPGADLAIIDKRRAKHNQSEVMHIIGEVKNRDCIIIDDIVDTAGTLCNAAKALKEQGAKSVAAYCTHPVLSGKAIELINQSEIDEVVVTDTIPLNGKAKACKKIQQLSLSDLIAEVLNRINNRESVSSLFNDD